MLEYNYSKKKNWGLITNCLTFEAFSKIEIDK